MKITSQTIWTDDKGHDLLVKKGPDEFYVSLANANLDTLKELAAAIQNAVNAHHSDECGKRLVPDISR